MAKGKLICTLQTNMCMAMAQKYENKRIRRKS